MPHKIRMKTIFAFSDIHEGTLPPRLLAVAEESDYVFFLGDGAARMGDLALHKGFFAVKGNCDFLPLPEETVTEVEGVKILLTHGHRYGVNVSNRRLAEEARDRGCGLAFFGHTHRPQMEEVGGVTCINPGSLSYPRQFDRRPSFMLIEQEDNGRLHFHQGYVVQNEVHLLMKRDHILPHLIQHISQKPAQITHRLSGLFPVESYQRIYAVQRIKEEMRIQLVSHIHEFGLHPSSFSFYPQTFGFFPEILGLHPPFAIENSHRKPCHQGQHGHVSEKESEFDPGTYSPERFRP